MNTMKINLLLLMMLTSYFVGYSQKPSNIVEEKKETTQKIMPQFPGGDVAFYDFLDKNVKLPEGFNKEQYLKEHHNQFVPISVSFTIDIDGTITKIKVIEGENEQLDKKAVEIIGNMPKWSPGSIDGTPIKVEYAIPIRFNLM